MDDIPTYSASGQRLRNRTLDNIEHLLALSKVVVRRSRRGKITVAQFRPLSGANPLGHALTGTQYSFHGVGDERLLWRHRDLAGVTVMDFLEVPLSCVPARATTTRPKVVCISTRRRPPSRLPSAEDRRAA
jgi:hypothetical protein